MFASKSGMLLDLGNKSTEVRERLWFWLNIDTLNMVTVLLTFLNFNLSLTLSLSCPTTSICKQWCIVLNLHANMLTMVAGMGLGLLCSPS